MIIIGYLLGCFYKKSFCYWCFIFGGYVGGECFALGCRKGYGLFSRALLGSIIILFVVGNLILFVEYFCFLEEIGWKNRRLCWWTGYGCCIYCCFYCKCYNYYLVLGKIFRGFCF